MIWKKQPAGNEQNQPQPAVKYSPVLPATWELVIADMRDRDRVGRAKYGTPLQPRNGRDSLVDAYQEALDLVVYLRNEIEERKHRAPATSSAGDLQEILILNTELEQSRADLTEALDALAPFAKWKNAPEEVKALGREAMPVAVAVFDRCAAVLAKHRPPAPDSTPPRRDGVAGDVQPLRPREQ